MAVSGYDDVGSAAVGRGSIFFEDVEVPAERMLAEENAAFRTVMSGFDYSRALIGLQCLAVAEVSLRETWTYATEREAFGAPIVKNQGVSEPLAEAETWIEAAKLLCYKTLWLRDRGEPHTAEAAMCKWWAPKVAFDVIHRCLLTHGHFAYTRDLPFEQRLRDVMGLQIGDGTSQIQKMIIARERVAGSPSRTVEPLRWCRCRYGGMAGSQRCRCASGPAGVLGVGARGRKSVVFSSWNRYLIRREPLLQPHQPLGGRVSLSTFSADIHDIGSGTRFPPPCSLIGPPAIATICQ